MTTHSYILYHRNNVTLVEKILDNNKIEYKKIPVGLFSNCAFLCSITKEQLNFLTLSDKDIVSQQITH